MSLATRIVGTALLLALLIPALRADTKPAQAYEYEYTIDLGIDVDTSGNGDATLGPTEACNITPLQVGDSIDVDIVVRGIPPYDSTEGRGIIGTDLTLIFDPNVVHVTGAGLFDGPTILKAGGPVQPFVWYDFNHHLGDSPEGPPGVIGATEVSLIDLSHDVESGDGVLMRFTLLAVGEGTSSLDVADNIAGRTFPGVYENSAPDGEVNAYAINESDATIVVGGACPMPLVATDSPTPTPTPTPVAPPASTTPAITAAATGSDTTTGTPTPSPTITRSPSVSPQLPGPSLTVAASDEVGRSPSRLGTWPIAGAAAMAVGFAIISGFAIARRRL